MTCTHPTGDRECGATAYYIDGSERLCAYHLARQSERARKPLDGPEARRRNRSQMEKWAMERAQDRVRHKPHGG